MPRRLHPTLADYLVVGIIPLLIMMLVGSLVFFLQSVFYQGQYDLRLQWILGLFVMATVLIARISIQEGREYATLYALPLALVSGLAMSRFVQVQGVGGWTSSLFGWTLLGIVWFCADRLTWDCSAVDESRSPKKGEDETSGQGLWQQAGFEPAEVAPGDPPATGDLPATGDQEAATAEPTKVASGTLWQRYLHYRRRHRTPGLSVVYFSLAAIPLFGLGQWFLPSDPEARRAAFSYLYLYVGSAFGLLLSTAFLNLRRYLRERQVEMPAEMTAAWLASGAAIIVALLTICMFIPQRGREFSIAELPLRLVSPERLQPDRHAFFDDGPETDDAQRTGQVTEQLEESHGDSSDHAPRRDGSSEATDERQNGDNAQDGGGSDRVAGDADSADADSAPSDSTDRDAPDSGSAEGPDAPDADTQAAPAQPAPDSEPRSTEETAADDLAGNGQQPDDRADGDDPATPARDRGDGSEDPDASEPQDGDHRAGRSERATASRTDPGQWMSQMAGGLVWLLRALFYVVLIAVFVYLVWKYRDELVQSLRTLLDRLRQWLGGPQAAPNEAPVMERPEPAARRFADFPNPFVTGQAAQMKPEELVRYTFEAFEAWAAEAGYPRHADATPHEFARQIARRYPQLGSSVSRMAELYGRVAYGGRVPRADCHRLLESFWSILSRSNRSAANPSRGEAEIAG